jgi:sensor domain CHASE-containing protein
MNIWRKMLGVILTTLVLLVVVGYLIARVEIVDRYIALENKTIVQDLDLIKSEIASTNHQLILLGEDWGNWDETYAFVQQFDPAYVENNLSVEILSPLEIDLMAFFDQRGQLVYGLNYSKDSLQFVPLSADFSAALASSNILSAGVDGPGKNGLVFLNNKAILLVTKPILDSKAKGPAMGTLVIGRAMESEKLQLVVASGEHTLEILALSQSTDDIKKSLLASASQNQFVTPINEQFIAGYFLLDGLNNQPVGVMKLTQPRSIYQEGMRSVQLLVGGVAVAGF